MEDMELDECLESTGNLGWVDMSAINESPKTDLSVVTHTILNMHELNSVSTFGTTAVLDQTMTPQSSSQFENSNADMSEMDKDAQIQYLNVKLYQYQSQGATQANTDDSMADGVKTSSAIGC